MSDPLDRRSEESDALALVLDEARRYLAELDESPCCRLGAAVSMGASRRLVPASPPRGAEATELLAGSDVATRPPALASSTSSPAASTPAALGADWLTSPLDQNGFAGRGSPLGAELERVSVRWLLDLFELPEGWGGVLTSGATMANFSDSRAARRWWARGTGLTWTPGRSPGFRQFRSSRRRTSTRAVERRSDGGSRARRVLREIRSTPSRSAGPAARAGRPQS